MEACEEIEGAAADPPERVLIAVSIGGMMWSWASWRVRKQYRLERLIYVEVRYRDIF